MRDNRLENPKASRFGRARAIRTNRRSPIVPVFADCSSGPHTGDLPHTRAPMTDIFTAAQFVTWFLCP
jgi:hypothetical protein